MQQFFHGLSLPFHLLRVLWADPVARRRYLRVGVLQCMAVIVLALTCHDAGRKADDATLKLARGADRAGAAADARAEAPAKPAEGGFAGFIEEPKRLAKRIQALAAMSEVQFWLSLFAAMQIAQWVVIALSRDYHDAIGRDVSLLTAIEPEDEPVTPRPRIDMKWVRTRVRRYLRGVQVVLAGLPVIYAFTAPLPNTDTLLAVLIPLWSGYWVVVFTTAKSARAWTDSNAGEPWFLRGWNWLTTRVPGFRWRFLQRYGLFWANRTRDMFAPAAEMEKQPWAFSGLALVRMLSEFPLLKCFLRPLIPVAAAHLLVARREDDMAKLSELSTPPAEPPASSSASAA